MTKDTKSLLIESAVQYRGYIIHEWVYLEKAIEFYLAKYFTDNPTKQKEIFRILINRLTFRTKLDVLRSVLIKKQEVEENFIKTKKNSYKCTKLIDRLRRINDERNCFAHYYLNTHEPALDRYPNEIEFIDSTDKGVFNVYNKDKCEILIDEIRACLKIVNELG